MLDQYRQDLNTDSDQLNEGRFQMSRRKVVFTLFGAALALLFFLFIIGAFRSEEEATTEKETTTAVASELQELQGRVEKLEQMLQGGSIVAVNKPNSPALDVASVNDQALKQLIATNTGDEISNQEAITFPQDDQPQASTQVTPPQAQSAPKAPTSRTYVVQKGDTLSKISQKYYGTTKRWKQIYDANRERISNINNLKVGTKLEIPEDKSK